MKMILGTTFLLAFLMVGWPARALLDRCSDPPASRASSLPPSECIATAGFSWHEDSQECVYEPRAGCASTRNKFLRQERCVQACMPMPATTTTESLPETTTITADDTSKCSLVPLVFSSDASCNGGFHPGPCPSEELLSVKVVYYDWNVQECHDSHLKICPGTEANIFNDFNAFRTQFQCHEECSPEEAACKQAFAESESYQRDLPHEKRYSYNQESKQCEPFIFIISNMEGAGNNFESLEDCEETCIVSRVNNSSPTALDMTMPDPQIPELWQCTDVPALKEEASGPRRSCLAYDNSNGYTYYKGHCVPSDYNGCIDTYNKFKDLEACTKTCVDGAAHSCTPSARATSATCESSRLLAHPIRAFTFDGVRGECLEFQFNGCSKGNNVFLGHQACVEACRLVGQ